MHAKVPGQSLVRDQLAINHAAILSPQRHAVTYGVLADADSYFRIACLRGGCARLKVTFRRKPLVFLAG
jgi:hypothetical protein